MKNSIILYIYCEGPTEESFINNILYPYLSNINIYVKPIICETKRTVNRKYKGGVSDYKKIKDELSRLCKQHKNEQLTTMFDYYGLPENTPGLDDKSGDLFERISRIEQAVEDDIGMRNLFFNLTVHEFEGLLFSNTSAFTSITDKRTVSKLQEIRNSFASPEHINDSFSDAPSKRLEKHIPGYSKVTNGTILSTQVGIDVIIKECKHFGKWISRICSLGMQK